MKEATRKNIKALQNKVGNNVFTEKDCEGLVSISTLKKNGLVKEAWGEKVLEEVSIDELIRFTNDLIGYYNEYDFTFKKENGKIYKIKTFMGYKFKK